MQTQTSGEILNTKGNFNGKHLIAQAGVNGKRMQLHIKYRGTGINEFLKAGDVIEVAGEVTDIDTVNCSSLQLLNRITKAALMNSIFFIKLD